jgi:hypothetical protein
VTEKIKMVRRQNGPIEIWLPEDCVGDTLTHWQTVFGDLCVIEGE